jgi:uncharacterized membrane protein
VENGRSSRSEKQEDCLAPLIVLIAGFAVFFVAGQLGVSWFHLWTHALRAALACMLVLTASAHWGKRRKDLIAMVPPQFPRADLIVTITGLLEIAAAIGLLFEPTHRIAALSLVGLFVAMFPANVRAAKQHLTIGGRSVLGVIPRGAIQLVFIAAALLCAF